MECINKTLSKSRMRQGESFPLRFSIYTKESTGSPSKVVVGEYTQGATDEIKANKLSILVADMRKVWAGEVTDTISYNTLYRCWLFPISQSESLALPAGEYPGLIKVKFESGDVLTSEIDPLLLIESIDKEEL